MISEIEHYFIFGNPKFDSNYNFLIAFSEHLILLHVHPSTVRLGPVIRRFTRHDLDLSSKISKVTFDDRI